jgi:hypothetical protein
MWMSPYYLPGAMKQIRAIFRLLIMAFSVLVTLLFARSFSHNDSVAYQAKTPIDISSLRGAITESRG